MARQLFGTDGIRGVAGRFPLDPKTVHATGIAVGEFATGHGARPEVVLGIDTRESSPWLAAQVAGGLRRAGAHPRYAGLIPTPGISYLTRTNDFVAGIMISASHNLYNDNGIKVFSHTGYKLPDEDEHAIEDRIFALLQEDEEPAAAELSEDPALGRTYLDHLASTVSADLDGLYIVADCAHGAATPLARPLFERLGARVETIGSSPDGRNINLGCGSLHVEGLKEAVLSLDADLGVAFDGDADRAIFVTRSGKIADGDAVLLVAARHLLAQGRLPGPDGVPTVVATVMSNLGLGIALSRHGIRMLRTAVGDKYVLEEMLRQGVMLGGEQSGHIIFREYAATGDGLLTALHVMEIMRECAASLDELIAELETRPQLLINVAVRSRGPLEELPEVAAEIRAAQEAFGGSGRVLVRLSGTELLARIMVEGPDAAAVHERAHRIAAAVQRALG